VESGFGSIGMEEMKGPTVRVDWGGWTTLFLFPLSLPPYLIHRYLLLWFPLPYLASVRAILNTLTVILHVVLKDTNCQVT